MKKTLIKKISIFLAVIACVFWGSLFPSIKLGYAAFHISNSDVPSLILFAGIRFAFSGILLTLFFTVRQRRLYLPTKENLSTISWVALFNIFLQYMFMYVALATQQGSKSAILAQAGYLFIGCFAFVFVKDDKFSIRKVVCGVLGFLGIAITSFNGDTTIFSTGDILVVLASFSIVVSDIVAKKNLHKISPWQLVAYSNLIGGIALLLVGVLFGGKIVYVDFKTILILSYICFASIFAYIFWNIALKYNKISKLSVIKFSQSLFAAFFSWCLLSENIFRIQYLISAIVIFIAIFASRNIKGEES